MLSCPNCSQALTRVKSPWGNVYACTGCGGRMVALAVMRRDHAARAFLGTLWQGARASMGALGGRLCPHCLLPMPEIEMPKGFGGVRLDVCTHCHGVWFDPKEYRAVPHVEEEGPAEEVKELSLPAREAVAMMELERLKLEEEMKEARAEAAMGKRSGHMVYPHFGEGLTAPGDGPTELWKLIPAVLGMPVESEVPAITLRPLATWTTAALIAAVFLGTVAHLGEAVGEWGFVPADWSRHGGLTLLTSFFLHGGILHLVGNLYFLVVFGDNVEDRLGKARFLLLLVGAHLAGMALHASFGPRSDIPCVGASAGIFGVVAYYGVAFPRAKLSFFVGLGFRLSWLRVPAWGMLLFYFAVQLLGALDQVSGFTNVSALAHLGGIAVGVAAAFASRVTRGRGIPRA